MPIQRKRALATILPANNFQPRRGYRISEAASTSHPNKFAHLADGTVVMMLERRNGVVLPCLIDAGDWEMVRQYRWSVHVKRNTYYAETRTAIKKIRLHQFLHSAGADHIDGNGLNNRRNNLRPANENQNAANRRKTSSNTSSAFRGVGWRKHAGKWRAEICASGVKYSLGYFENEEAAACAYDAAAVKHFGKFAKTNFTADVRQVEAA